MLSAHEQAILQAVASIPKGRVSSYGRVARMAGLPGYARQVGQMLKKLPPGSQIPWHRVINSRGQISFAPGSASYEAQRKKLAQEGIEFTNGKLTTLDCFWPDNQDE